MKISVALCTYNGSRFLPDQLESIRAQTRFPDELVICDDCSSDNTVSLLQTFKESVSFSIHIHKNSVNLKSTKNFEKCIQLCTGDIIVLSDQDDYWKPCKISTIASIFEENPEAGYVFSNAEVVNENLQTLGYDLWESVGFKGEIRDSFLEGNQLSCLLKQHIATGATMAFRSEYRSLALPFPEDTAWIHDGWLAIFLSALGAPGIPIQEELILYRQHSNQQIGASAPVHSQTTPKVLSKSASLLKKIILVCSQRSPIDGQEAFLNTCLILRNRVGKYDKLNETGSKNYKYLNDYYLHNKNRESAHKVKLLKKLNLCFGELSSGRYKEFSNSWKSFLRDVFL